MLAPPARFPKILAQFKIFYRRLIARARRAALNRAPGEPGEAGRRQDGERLMKQHIRKFAIAAAMALAVSGVAQAKDQDDDDGGKHAAFRPCTAFTSLPPRASTSSQASRNRRPSLKRSASMVTALSRPGGDGQHQRLDNAEPAGQAPGLTMSRQTVRAPSNSVHHQSTGPDFDLFVISKTLKFR